MLNCIKTRAGCENGFDELKNQWGWGGFTTQDIERCQTSARSAALVYNWWSWYCRAAQPGFRVEAITSRALLLAGVGRAVKHAGQTTLYLTAMHAAKDKLMELIANIRAVLSHVRAVAQQLPRTDRWKTFLDYVVAKITRPLPPWHRPDRLAMAGHLQEIGLTHLGMLLYPVGIAWVNYCLARASPVIFSHPARRIGCRPCRFKGACRVSVRPSSRRAAVQPWMNARRASS